jgi:signal transduction histidine kinase
VKARVLEEVVRGIPLEDALTRIVRLVEAASPEEVIGSALLVDEGGSYLVPGVAPGLDREFLESIGPVPVGPGSGSCGSAAYLGQPVVVDDIAHDSRWEAYREPALAQGLKACWSVPISGEHGKVLGTFAMYSRRPRTPTAFEMDLLGAASDLAAVAIEKDERRRLVDRLADEHARIAILQREDSLLRQVIRNAPAMIAITQGPQHTVVLANARFADAAGLTDSAIAGRPLLDVLDCIEPEAFGAILDDVYLSKRSYSRREMRLTLHRPGGVLLDAHVDFLCQPMSIGQDGDGLYLQAVDVTDSVRARDQMRQVQRVKDEFLEALAHDLRNPATVIGGNAAIMLRSLETRRFEPEMFRECLESISVTAHRLSLRAREIMDVLRMDAGQPVQVLREPVDIVAMIRQVLTDFARAGDSHPIQIECSEEAIVGEWDPVHVETVLVNLLSNAFKFSPLDRPVKIRLERQENAVRVQVIDRGRGIQAEDLPHIFDRFWRSSVSGVQRGAGIGLASARRSVELLGGTIGAESEPGVGSTFTFTLPR